MGSERVPAVVPGSYLAVFKPVYTLGIDLDPPRASHRAQPFRGGAGYTGPLCVTGCQDSSREILWPLWWQGQLVCSAVGLVKLIPGLLTEFSVPCLQSRTTNSDLPDTRECEVEAWCGAHLRTRHLGGRGRRIQSSRSCSAAEGVRGQPGFCETLWKATIKQNKIICLHSLLTEIPGIEIVCS